MGNRMPRCGVYWKCQSDREGRYGAENPEGNRVWYSKYGRRSGRYACDDTFDTADEFFEHRCARGYPEDWSEIVELDCMPEQYGQAGKYWKVPAILSSPISCVGASPSATSVATSSSKALTSTSGTAASWAGLRTGPRSRMSTTIHANTVRVSTGSAATATPRTWCTSPAGATCGAIPATSVTISPFAMWLSTCPTAASMVGQRTGRTFASSSAGRRQTQNGTTLTSRNGRCSRIHALVLNDDMYDSNLH